MSESQRSDPEYNIPLQPLPDQPIPIRLSHLLRYLRRHALEMPRMAARGEEYWRGYGDCATDLLALLEID